MLETDDVDVDLFTPASSTSLAHIFKKSSQVEDGTDKATLKYIPQPPPTNEDVSKPGDIKPTECIFACATYAYEWANNTYINKGKLGFALMKILKNSTHNFILYDANKTTLSCATLTPKFEVQVKDNVSISYYDNTQKYWSINAKDNEMYKILEILKELNLNLKYSTEQEHGPPNSNPVQKNINKNKDKQMSLEDRTSDTDSSIHRRTKDSILRRMATMGHSVLPQTQKNIETSDSSDSNESSTLRRASKHKPLKSYNSNANKHVLETVDGSTAKESIMNRPYEGTSNIYENPNEVITCKSLEIVNNRREDIAGVGMSDVSLLISEQRVSNSELRINMNRISDKLDLVIDKLKPNCITDKGLGESNYQNIIVQKLLNEYEMKIKKYEEIILAHDLESKNYKFDKQNNMPNDNLCHNVPVISNEDENKEKDKTISQLKDELIKVTKQNENFTQKEKTYLEEITNLKKEIDFKDEQLTNLNRKIDDTSSNFQKSDDAKNKIKSIMNDTFQSIATNFTNEESYSGVKVKNIVAAVIKKTTIEAISDL